MMEENMQLAGPTVNSENALGSLDFEMFREIDYGSTTTLFLDLGL